MLAKQMQQLRHLTNSAGEDAILVIFCSRISVIRTTDCIPYHCGVQRAGVWLGVGRGGSVREDEVLLEEEEGEAVRLLVDRDPLTLVPVQVVVLHQHLKSKCQQHEIHVCLWNINLNLFTH